MHAGGGLERILFQQMLVLPPFFNEEILIWWCCGSCCLLTARRLWVRCPSLGPFCVEFHSSTRDPKTWRRWRPGGRKQISGWVEANMPNICRFWRRNSDNRWLHFISSALSPVSPQGTLHSLSSPASYSSLCSPGYLPSLFLCRFISRRKQSHQLRNALSAETGSSTPTSLIIMKVNVVPKFVQAVHRSSLASSVEGGWA